MRIKLVKYKNERKVPDDKYQTNIIQMPNIKYQKTTVVSKQERYKRNIRQRNQLKCHESNTDKGRDITDSISLISK